MHRIGIDLGGTKTELIVTGENPLDVIEKKRVETERSGYQALLKQLEDLVDSVGNLALENPAVGLGVHRDLLIRKQEPLAVPTSGP